MRIPAITYLASIAFVVLPIVAWSQTCGLCAKEVVVNATSAPCLVEALEDLSAASAPFLSIDLSQCVETAIKNRGVVPSLPKALDAPQPTARFILDAQNTNCLTYELDSLEGKLDPFAIINLSKCP